MSSARQKPPLYIGIAATSPHSSSAIVRSKRRFPRPARQSKHFRAICSSSPRTCSQRNASRIAFSLLSGMRAALWANRARHLPYRGAGFRRPAGRNRSASTRWNSNPSSTGPPHFAMFGRRASAVPAANCRGFATRRSPNTSVAAIDPTPSARRGYHPICTSAKSRRGKCGMRLNDDNRKKAPFSAAPRAKFLAELGWREFAHHVLYHFPHTSDQPLREEFKRFPWRRDARRSRPGSVGKRASPSSMPECANCGPRVGCTIACE